MISSRSRIVAQIARRQTARAFSAVSASKASSATDHWATLAVATVASVTLLYSTSSHNESKTLLAAPIPSSGDLISTGTPVEEPGTGILFPQLCNGLYYTGCGYRVKYGFFKVYAVGTYMDPLSLGAVKKSTPEAIQTALLDPTYPRTIRIVMNRALSTDKFIAAIVEALEPRMMGQDMDALEEFKKLNPPVDMVKGAEIEMTIRGDTLLYKNAVGGVGTIRSHAFCKAMCDVYYGFDPVSPTHKASVLEGIPKL